MSKGSTTLNLVTQFQGANSPYYLGRFPTALSVLTFTSPATNTTQEFLFVTSNNDPILHNDNTLSVYSVSSSGLLTEQANSPYVTSTDPISVLAVDTNTAGTNNGGVFIYVGSQPTATGALNIFTVCTIVGNNNCTQADVLNSLLLPVNASAPPAPGSWPIAMAVDSTNTFLYVACENSSQVFGYKIGSAGALTVTSPSNQPTGSRPVALALHPSVNATGEFLYTSNNGSSNISGFPISTTTGSMGTQITVQTPSIPTGMAAR